MTQVGPAQFGGNMNETRFVRVCDTCAGVDSHPRHVTNFGREVVEAIPSPTVVREAVANGASDEALAEVMDPTTTVRHIDCCAANGCESCSQTMKASGNASGQALIDFLTGGS